MATWFLFSIYSYENCVLYYHVMASLFLIFTQWQLCSSILPNCNFVPCFHISSIFVYVQFSTLLYCHNCNKIINKQNIIFKKTLLASFIVSIQYSSFPKYLQNCDKWHFFFVFSPHVRHYSTVQIQSFVSDSAG